jgi:hypothetical protein
MLSGDRKNLFFRFVKERFKFPLLVVALRRKLRAGGDESAQDVLLTDDIDVVASIRCGGKKALKVAEKFRTTDLLKQVPIFQRLFD